jgi:hypothetical protein
VTASIGNYALPGEDRKIRGHVQVLRSGPARDVNIEWYIDGHPPLTRFVALLCPDGEWFDLDFLPDGQWWEQITLVRVRYWDAQEVGRWENTFKGGVTGTPFGSPYLWPLEDRYVAP